MAQDQHGHRPRRAQPTHLALLGDGQRRQRVEQHHDRRDQRRAPNGRPLHEREVAPLAVRHGPPAEPGEEIRVRDLHGRPQQREADRPAEHGRAPAQPRPHETHHAPIRREDGAQHQIAHKGPAAGPIHVAHQPVQQHRVEHPPGHEELDSRPPRTQPLSPPHHRDQRHPRQRKQPPFREAQRQQHPRKHGPTVILHKTPHGPRMMRKPSPQFKPRPIVDAAEDLAAEGQHGVPRIARIGTRGPPRVQCEGGALARVHATCGHLDASAARSRAFPGAFGLRWPCYRGNRDRSRTMR